MSLTQFLNKKVKVNIQQNKINVFNQEKTIVKSNQIKQSHPLKKQIQTNNQNKSIFVGNVSIQTTKKQLKKFFSKYGKVLKIRFRSVATQESKLPIKAKIILKKFNQQVQSMNCYVTFEKQQQAQNALNANGQIFKDLTLRITMQNQKNLDYSTTIFVGNLNFKLNQEDIRNFFKKCGQIQYVRLIRQKTTRNSKGIAYIKFTSKQGMNNAISLNNYQLMQRQIRIKKATPKNRLQKKLFKKQLKYQKKQEKILNKQGNNQNNPQEQEVKMMKRRKKKLRLKI